MSKETSKEISEENAKILAWLYTVEVSGDNRAAENLKQEAPLCLQEWSRRNGLETLTRPYEVARQYNQTPPVDRE